MTFNVILEHKETKRLKFITVAECANEDDCIEHIIATEPDFWIEQIRPV